MRSRAMAMFAGSLRSSRTGPRTGESLSLRSPPASRLRPFHLLRLAILFDLLSMAVPIIICSRSWSRA